MAISVNGDRTKAVWVAVAVGTAVGLGIALSRGSRKKTAWESAREVTKRVANRSGDISEAARDIMERVKTIYDEGCKVIADASELWSHGRKLVRS